MRRRSTNSSATRLRACASTSAWASGRAQRRLAAGRPGVAAHDLAAEVGDDFEVAVEHARRTRAHAAQLLVLSRRPRPGSSRAGRARGSGPSATWRTSRPTAAARARRSAPRAARTRAASGAAATRPVRGAGHRPLMREERCDLALAHPDLRRDGSRRRSVFRPRRACELGDDAAWTALRASSGSRTAASPASLRISRTSQSTPAKLSSTTTEPSGHSSTTRRDSRAQRARSGEIQTRAVREAATSPVRSQPSTSAAGSTSRSRLELLGRDGRGLDAVQPEMADVFALRVEGCDDTSPRGR